eukprot:scaffold82034_cov48-Phaeocystis_antarctica.AAC.2
MSTAKCWSFGHIGVAPSSASGCKVSSYRALFRSAPCRATTVPVHESPLSPCPPRCPHCSREMPTLSIHTDGRNPCGRSAERRSLRGVSA